MKSWKSPFIVVALLIVVRSAFALDIGDTAPNVILKTEDKEVSLSAFKGDVVLLDVWASWCSSCAHSLPWINDLQKKLGARRFTVMGINVDTDKNAAQAFLKKHNIDLATAFDPTGDIPDQLGMKAMPTSYIINREGKIVAIHEGFSDSEKESFEEEIRKVL